MKKLALLVIFFSFISISANAQTGKIWIEQDTTYFQKDTSFVLVVKCDEYITGVKAIRLDFDVNSGIISFDTTLNLPNDSIAVALGGMFSPLNEITFFADYLWPDSNRFTVDIALLPDSATFDGPGEMLILPIYTVDFGESLISIANANLIDRYGAPIDVVVNSSWVKVCQFVGDVNADNSYDIADLVYFIEYVVGDPYGPAPNPLQSGNINCDNEVDIADVVHMIEHILNDGPPPCDKCL